VARKDALAKRPRNSAGRRRDRFRRSEPPHASLQTSDRRYAGSLPGEQERSRRTHRVTLDFPYSRSKTTRVTMTGWLSDLRFGLRLLGRNLEVTIVAVLAMALAIGVAGTVFSVVNAVLIQPLPFRQPRRLVAIWQVDPANAAQWRPCAAGNYADFRRESGS